MKQKNFKIFFSRLTRSNVPFGTYEFSKIDTILDYKKEKCIFVPSLMIDYSMILDDVVLVITKIGSKLSHLAIIANEKGKVILKIEEEFFDKVQKEGIVFIDKEGYLFVK